MATIPRFHCLLLLAGGLLLLNFAHAWHSQPHMIIASIARRHMSLLAQVKVDYILGLWRGQYPSQSTLERSAVWLDDMNARGPPSFGREMRYDFLKIFRFMHGVNFPYNPAGIELRGLDAFLPIYERSADFLLDLAYEGLNATTPIIDNLEDPYCHTPVSLTSPFLSSLLEESSVVVSRPPPPPLEEEEELPTRASSFSPSLLQESPPENKEGEVNVFHREGIDQSHSHEEEDLISFSSLSSSTIQTESKPHEERGKGETHHPTRRRTESREGHFSHRPSSRSRHLAETSPPPPPPQSSSSPTASQRLPLTKGDRAEVEEKEKKRQDNVAGVGSILSLNLYLRMLVHLMGDIHQPLHTCLAFSPAFPTGDKFGTKISLVMPDGSGSTNLHAFWDAAANAYLKRFHQITDDEIQAEADEIMKEYPREMFEVRNRLRRDLLAPNFRAIAIETHRLGVAQVYKEFDFSRFSEKDLPYHPSMEYIEDSRAFSRSQIAVAGYRLAHALESISKLLPLPPRYLQAVEAAEILQGKLGVRHRA